MRNTDGRALLASEARESNAPLTMSLPHSPLPFPLLLPPSPRSSRPRRVEHGGRRDAAGGRGGRGAMSLRFYQWEEPTLSLGYSRLCRPPASPGQRRLPGGPPPERRRGHLARYRIDLQPRGAGASSAGRQSFADVPSGSPVADRGIGASGESRRRCCTPHAPRESCLRHADVTDERPHAEREEYSTAAVSVLPTAVAG